MTAPILKKTALDDADDYDDDDDDDDDDMLYDDTVLLGLTNVLYVHGPYPVTVTDIGNPAFVTKEGSPQVSNYVHTET